MKRYAVIDYTFCGKIDYEVDGTISVNNSRYWKDRVHIQRITLLQYCLIKLLTKLLDYLIV